MTKPVKNKSIFNAKYETGKCLYSYVVSKDKESRIDLNSYSINASGGVYRDFGNGEGEYIGELDESTFTVKDMNNLLDEIAHYTETDIIDGGSLKTTDVSKIRIGSANKAILFVAFTCMFVVFTLHLQRR